MAGQVIRSEGKPLRTQRNNGTKKPLDCVRRNGLRVFYVDLVSAHAHENKGIAITPNTENTLHSYMLFGLQIFEPPGDLPHNCLKAMSVFILRDLSRTLWVFVLNHYTAILRIDAPTGKPILMAPLD